MSVPDDVREAICAEIEESLRGISVGEDADGMSYGILDAIAEARHETDLRGAGDILRDASADILDAALSALEAAGWVCVPKVPTQQMLKAAASVWKEGYSIGYRHPITRDFSPALGGPSSAEIYAAMLTVSRHKEKNDG